jgi:hypothetical protein
MDSVHLLYLGDVYLKKYVGLWRLFPRLGKNGSNAGWYTAGARGGRLPLYLFGLATLSGCALSQRAASALVVMFLGMLISVLPALLRRNT